jgi:hypothetical protein|tara:strand:- start:1134 stop:1262 length:129 start_codon:yes stop_codon:yes gene_type:complete
VENVSRKTKEGLTRRKQIGNPKGLEKEEAHVKSKYIILSPSL